MPNYNALPAPGSLTIERALLAARYSITIPVRVMIGGGFFLGIVLIPCGFPAWYMPVIFISGLIMAFLYLMWMTPKWRIWAYTGVEDIHQFQRSAEYDGLLPAQSPMQNYGIMTRKQRLLLQELQEKFSEDEPFVDDPSIESCSRVYLQGVFAYSGPEIEISDTGIATSENGFYPWAEIGDVNIVYKGSTYMSKTGSYGNGDGGVPYFAYYSPAGYTTIKLSKLDITAKDLDLLVYTHRGRYEKGKTG